MSVIFETQWAGEISKRLDNATELQIDHSFAKLSIGEPLLQLSDDVIKNLSVDQAYRYKITQATKTGELQADLALLEIGLSHICFEAWSNRQNPDKLKTNS